MTHNTPSKSRLSSKVAKPKAQGVFGVKSSFAGIGRPSSDARAGSQPTGLRIGPPPLVIVGGSGGEGGGVEVDEGPYTAPAVRFDGANDFMQRGLLSGVANSKRGIFSCWIDVLDSGGHGKILFVEGGSVDIFRFTSSTVICRLDSPDTLNVVNMNSTPAVLEIGTGWVWLGISWDTNVAGAFAHMYFGDVQVEAEVPTDDEPLDYAPAGETYNIGANHLGNLNIDMNLADLYFQTGEFLDFTVEANRRKFIDANGKPVNLGSDGSRPTGNQPPLFMTGDAAAWNAGIANKGSGGAFSMTGSVDDAASSPSD